MGKDIFLLAIGERLYIYVFRYNYYLIPQLVGRLGGSGFADKVRNRHRIIINWFLGHLKRQHTAASKESARQFIEHLVETRQPADWSRKRLRLTRSCST